MLNLISVALDGASAEGVQRASESVHRQGFLWATELKWRNGSATAWSHPQERGSDNCEVRGEDGSALGVGPIWYRGQFGRAALPSLLRDVLAHGNIDPAQARGNYALLTVTGGQCLLMSDALGLVRIYASADQRFYSTSWLATCAYAGGVALDEAAAIEYVLLGASHSNATLAKGISTLQLGGSVDLRSGNIGRWLAGGGGWSEDPPAGTFGEMVERVAEYFRTVGREVAMAFPGRIRAALSGGFDSRLIVAGLLASGACPDLFVYGAPGSDDVRVAREVADAVGLPLEHIDKQALARDVPPLHPEDLTENALFFDGFSNDGVCDPGIDRQTRLAQTANGGVALNGGGGEIFRNYFHLPDRPLHAIDVVRAFYRGFDPRVFRRAGGVQAYQDRMVAAIEDCLRSQSGGGRRFKRSEIELLYPLFRCHFWMAMNNSIGVRHGYYSTPLIDYTTVRMASWLPMAWKNAGRLQSSLINQLHPLLAQQVSTYGFRFADGPNRHARFANWQTRIRPVRVRPWINALHRRIGRVGMSSDLIAQCRLLLPGEWRLDPILDLTRLPDRAALSRATAVEVAWRELLS